MRNVRISLDENIISFSENICEPAEENSKDSLVKVARLFYCGKHKGKNYTTEDLDKIIENFDPAEGVPVQLDHSQSAKDTVGFVRALERKGEELFGTLEFLGAQTVEKVRLGLWKKVSVGLKISHPQMKLAEVSITPFPALTDAVVFSGTDEDVRGGAEILRICDEEARAAAEEQRAVNMAEYESMLARFAELEMRNSKLEEQLKFNEDKETIESFVKAGRTTPAMMQAEIELFASLDDEQRGLFINYKNSAPLFVDFKTYCKVKAEKADDEEADAEKEAQRLLDVARKRR